MSFPVLAFLLLALSTYDLPPLPPLPPFDIGGAIATESLPPVVEDLIGIGVIVPVFASVFWLSRNSRHHRRIVLWMKRFLFLLFSGALLFKIVHYSKYIWMFEEDMYSLIILFIATGVVAWSMWDTRKIL